MPLEDGWTDGGETGGQTTQPTVEEIQPNMQTQSGRRLTANEANEAAKECPTDAIIYGHCKFSFDNSGSGGRDNDGGADSDRHDGVPRQTARFIPVGDRFNRGNFNLLAFLDGTQSRAEARA